jgi:hypothetical protein
LKLQIESQKVDLHNLQSTKNNETSLNQSDLRNTFASFGKKEKPAQHSPAESQSSSDMLDDEKSYEKDSINNELERKQE